MPTSSRKKTTTLANWLAEQPFTLALSSSFFGFYAHCGVATALYEAGLRPAKASGASAGALVAAALASGLEPRDLSKILFATRRQDFWDPFPGLGLLRGKKFRTILAQHFVADFSQTKIPLSVAAFDLLARKTVFLERGPLPSAVVASCAVPLMFHPVRIGRRLYLDGGLFEKSGLDPQQAERTLNVFLLNQGIAGTYEIRNSQRIASSSPSRQVLRFAALPQVHPGRLELGFEAFERALHRTRRALQQPLQSPLQDA